MGNKRLTKQDARGYTYNQVGQIINKLEKLEDLEEQIGCPLDVVIKAMSSEIYYDIASGTGTIVQPYLVVNDDGMFVFDTMGEESSDIFLNDYKQTWWLKEDIGANNGKI